MARRLSLVCALAILLVSACTERDEASPGPAADEASEGGPDLAGDLGPNGGILEGSAEFESTPESLYIDQTKGGTVVAPVDGIPAGLTALRDGDHLCLGLHGLPIGVNELAESCDITAYASHDKVVQTAWAYLSDIALDGQTTWIAWGMTYLDVATVDFGPDSRSQEPESNFPYWMHRFFALEAPEEATEVRLLDEAGNVMAILPLENRS